MRRVLYWDAIMLSLLGAVLLLSATRRGHFLPGVYWIGFGVVAVAGAILVALMWTKKVKR